MSVRTTVCSKSCCAALLPPKGPHKGQPNAGRSPGARSCCRRAFTAATCSRPIAARLARGETPDTVAHSAAPTRFADWPDDLAEIVYIDHYGNAMTGMRGETVAATASLVCGGRAIAPARTFSAVPPGAAFWYVNSNGLVEIAVNGGRADRLIELTIGSKIAIAPA